MILKPMDQKPMDQKPMVQKPMVQKLVRKSKRTISILAGLTSILSVTACGMKHPPGLDTRWMQGGGAQQRIMGSPETDALGYYTFGVTALKNLIAILDTVEMNGHPDRSDPCIQTQSKTTSFDIDSSQCGIKGNWLYNYYLTTSFDKNNKLQSLSESSPSRVDLQKITQNSTSSYTNEFKIQNESITVNVQNGVEVFQYHGILDFAASHAFKTGKIINQDDSQADVTIAGQLNRQDTKNQLLAFSKFHIEFTRFHNNKNVYTAILDLPIAQDPAHPTPIQAGVPIVDIPFNLSFNSGSVAKVIIHSTASSVSIISGRTDIPYANPAQMTRTQELFNFAQLAHTNISAQVPNAKATAKPAPAKQANPIKGNQGSGANPAAQKKG